MSLAPTSETQAQDAGLAPWTIEFSPVIGLNLPYDVWGTPGSLGVYGIRSAYSVTPESSAILGFLYHTADPDTAFTVDALYRFELKADGLLPYFDVGLHYSKFSFEVDLDDTGACVPSSCATDSGVHTGIAIGGGLLIPLSPTMPLRLGMRFYKKNPFLFLLLEAEIGFRF